ncbi:LPS translocon maturation chaperone LptM [Solemya elarraichensis gill symbiont]|uniref:LPS translocon maturation chaperone LptM n=1 Tax=Solemya elarraichensis gill symbiont TaxID=1918949 RepID=UPI001083D5BD|nr:lipoprotein [Solemya elarraichensis gill symbiont]
MHCYSRYLFIILIAILGIGNMLSGCGSKGDLYLPESSQPAQTSQPVVKPAGN